MRKTIFIAVLISMFAFVSTYCAEAAEIQEFYDDFESDIASWALQPGWSVILEDGNSLLQGTQHTFASAYLDGTANSLELKLKLLQGSIHLNIRSKPAPEGFNRYFVGLNEGGSYISKQVDNNFQHLEVGEGISLNEWHSIKIEIVNRRINVFSDGNLIVWTEDENLLQEGGVSFETLEDSIVHIDDVRVEVLMPEARELKAQELFPDGKHEGDLTLEGRDFLVLENGEFEQFGNIYLKDSSRLIIQGSIFKITRYQRLLNHWGIWLEDSASLEIENSKLFPGKSEEGPTLFVIEASGRAKVNMSNSSTQIHLFTMANNAKGVIDNSEIVSAIGGLVAAHGSADVTVRNSRIGAVNLEIPDGATFEASGLGTGFFERWNLHEDANVSGINYNITLINTELVKDTIGPGPYERGWPIFIESGAIVKIKDSELRKVVIMLRNETAEFANFYLEEATDFNYRNIDLENVIVKGQWGIFLYGSSDVIVRDSEAFWTFIHDDSKLTLINTHMNEFDPRNFHGEIIFENSRWDTAAEIIENNDFTIKGSLEIGRIGGFSWEDSNVTRVYDVIGKPNSELTLTKKGQVVWQGRTDENGSTSFSIKFEDTTFNDVFELKDDMGSKIGVSFFSATPLKMESPPLFPKIKFIILISILAVAAITIFLFQKKYLKKR